MRHRIINELETRNRALCKYIGILMIVIATQIRINNIAGFLRFMIRLRKIRGQLGNADGLLFIKFERTRTLTGWENYESMKAFRNNGHHLDAMRNIKKMGKTKSITWESESEPDWNEARERLRGVEF